mgnify:CR=1 FL=1
MTDKTKRIILIAAGVLLCAALVVGIVSRLAAVPMPIDPAIPDDTPLLPFSYMSSSVPPSFGPLGVT